MPPKTSKKAPTIVENKSNDFETFQNEWLEVTKEIITLKDKLTTLDSRKDELVTLMLKTKISNQVADSPATIVETPVVDIVVAEPVTKSKKKVEKPVEKEEEIPVNKASAKKVVKEEVVTVLKKPVSKKAKEPEPKPVAKKITKNDEKLKLYSSSSDTDLESLSSCSSESEFSAGED